MINAAEGFGQSLSFGPNAAQAAAASNRILGARESRLIEPLGKGDIPDTEGGITIELRDVRLRYAGRKTPVLSGLNMTIKKGQFVALVGASGCGKTSVVSLLEGFYKPEKGQILCNGKDISDVNIYTYRKHLSLVAQEPTLFQGTLRDNILLGIDPQPQHHHRRSTTLCLPRCFNPRLHRLPPRRLQHQHRLPRRLSLWWPKATRLHRPCPHPQPPGPPPRRSHQLSGL